MDVADADTVIARWWRRLLRRGVAHATRLVPAARDIMGKGMPAHALVKALAQTSAGKAVLQEHLAGLLARAASSSTKDAAGGRGGDRDRDSEASRLWTAVASTQRRLGMLEEAVDSISRATACDATDKSAAFAREIMLREWHTAVAQARLAKKHLASSVSTLDNDATLVPQPLSVPRRAAASLSREEFLAEFARPGKPVIITGLVPHMFPDGMWTLDHVAERVGHKSVTVKRFVKTSTSWAKLERHPVPVLLKDFIAAARCDTQTTASTGRTRLAQSYLHDWSIPQHAPELTSSVRIPTYVAGDWLQAAPSGAMFRETWPSLFIGPPRSFSSLHVDSFGSNFWMALLQGQKRWTFYSPECLPFLYPTWNLGANASPDPTFSVNPTRPSFDKFPLFRLARPTVCTLQPGEFLFVPAGSPHFVENLDSCTLAVSGNYVDSSNLTRARKELGVIGLVQPRAKELLAHLPVTPTGKPSTFSAPIHASIDEGRSRKRRRTVVGCAKVEEHVPLEPPAASVHASPEATAAHKLSLTVSWREFKRGVKSPRNSKIADVFEASPGVSLCVGGVCCCSCNMADVSQKTVTTRGELQSQRLRSAMRRRQQHRASKPKWLYLTPIAFAPVLPLIRIAFRKQPVLRDRLFFGTVGLALVHGTWLIARATEEDEQEHNNQPAHS